MIFLVIDSCFGYVYLQNINFHMKKPPPALSAIRSPVMANRQTSAMAGNKLMITARNDLMRPATAPVRFLDEQI